MKTNKFIFFLCLITTSSILLSCTKERTFEDNINLDSRSLSRQDTIQFSFEINDAMQHYDLLYNVRYGNEYRDYNLYLKYTLYDSLNKKIADRVDEMYLFDSKTGAPLGEGQGNLYFRRFLFLRDFAFPYQGKFKIGIEPYLRADPIIGVYSLGLLIEKHESE